MSSKTTIELNENTRDTLRGLKRGNESYDDVLKNMIEVYDPDEYHAPAEN